MPYATAAVAAVTGVAWLFPNRADAFGDPVAQWLVLLAGGILAAATVLCRHPRWGRHAVLLGSIAFSALPLLSSIYCLLIGVDGDLLAMFLVCFLAAIIKVLPLGFYGQIPVAFAAFAAYAGVIVAGMPTQHPAYLTVTFVAVISGIAIAGAYLYEESRRSIFRAHRDLRVAYEAVKAAGQTKNEFIANLSHELRTPLNTIVGYTDLILDNDFGPLSEEMRAPVERISKSADNLRALINDLIDLALIETGRLRVEMKDVPLAPIFDELTALAEPMLRDKPIRFRYAEPDSIAVRADAARLRQILTNLVGNAAKYTPQGEIEVSAEQRNGSVLIAVRDTGIGVPKDEMQAIFKPFYRGSRRGASAGVGLGLSMSARLAELMGGEITVESDIGKGTTFTLHLDAT